MRSHTAGLAQSMLTTLKFEVLTHLVNSPDLSLWDHEVFGLLKKCLDGKYFSTDEEVKKVAKEWMLQAGVTLRRG